MKTFLTITKLNPDDYVSELLTEDEILVRFVFLKSFKKKVLTLEKIIPGFLLEPYKSGASLQREKYSDEDKCVGYGSSIPSQKLVGFLIFKKSDFQTVREEFISSLASTGTESDLLDVKIVATPLNEKFEILPFKNDGIKIEGTYNPGHADVVYRKPDVSNKEALFEKPNPIIRSFSKKMYSKSEFVFTETIEEKVVYKGERFSKLIK
ncbi:hypothetical protein ACFLSU_08265 [Bacteroidota bacterium]